MDAIAELAYMMNLEKGRYSFLIGSGSSSPPIEARSELARMLDSGLVGAVVAAGSDESMEAALAGIDGDAGLVICGWDADDDASPLHFLKERDGVKTPVFWVTSAEPGEKVKALADSLSARYIFTDNLEAFFAELAWHLF